MTFDNLLHERADAVVVLTLNRPHVLNALDLGTLRDLERALDTIEADATVRAVVVTGAGDRAFAAGADIRELASLGPADARAHAAFGQRVFDRLERLPVPVIAAINGFALGGGCELALACTLRVAAQTARLGQPEIRLGIVPGFGATCRLPRLVGRAHAATLLLTGEPISAQDALAMGLVTRVVAAHELMPVALTLARQVAAQPAGAVKAVLELLREGADMPSRQAQQMESALFGLLAGTADAREGMAAFLEKRPPRFEAS